MSAVSDHVRRDAEHTARSEIRIFLSQFARRMDGQAYAGVRSKLEAAVAEGRAVNGIELGREAAHEAIAIYLDPGTPQPAVETTNALGSAAEGAPRPGL